MITVPLNICQLVTINYREEECQTIPMRGGGTWGGFHHVPAVTIHDSKWRGPESTSFRDSDVFRRSTLETLSAACNYNLGLYCVSWGSV